ncbi:prepilin-type N-terminal cleavage/methylation domain-containing protein [Aliikangiella sp. G2MR2-5]|uniref:prepilin-type N-terminal cleavage/methylation domain-containing protein n=1 Tax=Aliikangiella sp. G2MR2-5 TaxID=2788943 RepID=UPI0018AAEF62|nr:prepilin-type N-terminal cleavage/methylation domain-containing protein [Aliikangiella sp. G2MR2-5]
MIFLGSIKNLKSFPKHKGFTLFELIIVIVLIGILAISLGKISSVSVYSYIDAKDRNRMSHEARWIIERIAREARNAMAQSIRTGNNLGVDCVEFMPISNASISTNLPASGSISDFNAVAYNLSFQANTYVAIMPLTASSVYAINGVLAPIASVATTGNESTITLSSPSNFTHRSPENRFLIVSRPVSFCLDTSSGQLSRYEGYNINQVQQIPPSISGELIADNLSSGTGMFSYQPGVLSRSGILQINFRLQNSTRNLSGNSEAFEYFHEVHIRNVP